MFEIFIMGIPKEINPLVLLGVSISYWSLWLNRNDVVFQRKISLAGCLHNYPVGYLRMGYPKQNIKWVAKVPSKKIIKARR